MLESSNKDRIIFNKKGLQRKFILTSKQRLNITNVVLAGKLGVNQRTLADWSNEKFHISCFGARLLSKLSGVAIPKNYSILLWKNHMSEIGKIGGKKRLALYGSITTNEKYRSEKWNEWWQNVGKYKKPASGFNTLIKIGLPGKSERLAEFVGIMLGDGGVAPYHIHITLSNKEVGYAKYVTSLIKKLFGVIPKLYKLKNSNAVDIVVQRKELVDFCLEIGLVLGNKVKQQVDVPPWIKEDSRFVANCIRGLIDTDGCFYENSYVVAGKKYIYHKIAFTNSSKPLIDFVEGNLIKFGINAVIGRNHKDVRVVDSVSVEKYVKKIGFSNEKHFSKVKMWERHKVIGKK